MDRARCVDHDIASTVVFRESDKIPDGITSTKQGTKPVKPESETTVRRGSIFKRIH